MNCITLTILVVITLSASMGGHAATYTVTNTNDGGPGSLRAAVSAANSTPDNDVIAFDIPGCPGGVCTIVLTAGLINVADYEPSGSLTISNPTGPRSLIISGNYNDGVFYASQANLRIDGLTVKHGTGTGWVGAIQSWGGNLVITRSEIVENTGRGLSMMGGSLVVLDSTIANNNGGGFVTEWGFTTFANSTFSGNSAAAGGAVYIDDGGWVQFSNVTITNNSAQYAGGGVAVLPWYDPAGFSVRNTIVSGNSYNDIYIDLGVINDLGNNLISGSPVLGPLTNNGGPTRTHALLANSPAINAGNNCVLTENGCGDNNRALPRDQRSVRRAGSVDIGAYEFNPSAPEHDTLFDFDGDGRSDISVFRPSDSVWYLNRSTEGFFATQFGVSTDRIVPADYDGDGKTDVAVYRDGQWWIRKSTDGSVGAVQFGQAGDLLVPADYTGDGRDELAIYRNGEWWSLDLSNNRSSLLSFGLPADKPVPADYDGDGRVDQALYRSGQWHLNCSTLGSKVVSWGLPTDIPVVGDYDGDAKADPAVYREGTWYVLGSEVGWFEIRWGLATDVPVPADYDGDGRWDISIWRPSDGNWYFLGSTAGQIVKNFGTNGDRPIPSSFTHE